MDFMSIPVRDDGTTIYDIKTREQADTVLVELDFAIATLRNELDEAWSDKALRGIDSDADWLTDTKSELREKEAARNALRIHRATLKRESKGTHERIRQSILIESLKDVVTDTQWIEAITLFKTKYHAFEAGLYMPTSWNKPQETEDKNAEPV